MYLVFSKQPVLLVYPMNMRTPKQSAWGNVAVIISLGSMTPTKPRLSCGCEDHLVPAKGRPLKISELCDIACCELSYFHRYPAKGLKVKQIV